MKKTEKVTSISLLSRNLKIEGDISGNENFRVDGTVKGSINVSGDILVEKTGKVEASISGNNIVVKGSVNGNISANHRIELYATGLVIGDISARSVDIQEGAQFEGRSHMVQPDIAVKSSSEGSSAKEDKQKKDRTERSSE